MRERMQFRNDPILSEAFEPAQRLGGFDTLPVDVQNVIVKYIITNDRMSMAGHEIGKLHVILTRLLWRLRKNIPGHKLNRTKTFIEILARAFQSGPAHIIYALYLLKRSWQEKYLSHSTIQSFPDSPGKDIKDYAVCFARHVPQLKAYRGFWHDRARNNTYGVILGIDLISSPEGCWYIESNLNFGMSNIRSALYDNDPFVQNLFRFTAEKGFSSLMFVNNTYANMNSIMASQLEKEALRYKVDLRIVEDAYLPHSQYQQSFGIPSLKSHNTLVVRTKFYRTSLDYLLQNKLASCRALKLYQQNFKEPALLLPQTGAAPLISSIALDEPFPNVVLKNPGHDEGKGILFLKATSAEHAAAILRESRKSYRRKDFINRIYSSIEHQTPLFQSYIRSHLLNGRRLYKVRAHILLTPPGIYFLSAHRVISQYSVPDHLPLGVVRDSRPYLVNLASSSAYEVLPPEEESAVQSAAMAIARGFSWATSYGFNTVSENNRIP